MIKSTFKNSLFVVDIKKHLLDSKNKVFQADAQLFKNSSGSSHYKL